MNHFKNIIKAHLDGRASTDALFAKAYAKENKNIDECCNYIIGEVRKSKRQGFADEEIFNFAVHYYDEDEIKDIKAAPRCKIVVNTKLSAPAEPKAKAKAASKSNKRKQELVEEFEKRQLSLF